MPTDDPDDEPARDDDEAGGANVHYDDDGVEITQEHTTWAMLAHLGQFFFGFLAPLVIWLAYGSKSAYVVHHAKEAVNFFITLCFHAFGLIVVCGLGGLVGYSIQPTFWGVWIGYTVLAVPLSLAFVVWDLVVVIKATLAASRRQHYRYPFCLRLIG